MLILDCGMLFQVCSAAVRVPEYGTFCVEALHFTDNSLRSCFLRGNYGCTCSAWVFFVLVKLGVMFASGPEVFLCMLVMRMV